MPYGIYLLKTDFLEREDAFARALGRVSTARREKALSYARNEDKRLCLGAGLLLEYLLDRLRAGSGRRDVACFPSGRPFLPAFPETGISVSHSGSYALVACAEGPIGADVQTAISAPARMARLLDEEERAWCANDPARLTRLWTLKEAYIKYTGDGLTHKLPSVRFDAGRPFIPGSTCRLFEYPPIEGHFVSCCLDGDKPPFSLLAQDYLMQ